MSHISLRCTRCRASHVADMATLRCNDCGSPLEVQYADESMTGPTWPQPSKWTGPPIPLPIHDAKAMVSLGEGNTPCIELADLGDLLGLKGLYAKLEFLNPTGSFKDRGTAVMMSMAREHGVAEIVEDSSGNAGASVSAYAARAGIKAHIFAPASAPATKIQQIRVYGAEAHAVDGSREATTEATIVYYTERRLVYASHSLSPYFMEGTKTFAYEVAQQFPDGAPDHVVMPVGNGSLFIGAWLGFRELREAGHVSRTPRFHCIQARAIMPVVAAYGGHDWTSEAGASTVAGGISVASPPRLRQMLDVLKATRGVALAVEDEEILRWQRLLAEKEGIYGEPTSAAAFAGLDHLVRRGEVRSTDTVLVPVTGSGLKDAPPA